MVDLQHLPTSIVHRETTLAFVWTMNEVFRLSASPEKVCELLQHLTAIVCLRRIFFCARDQQAALPRALCLLRSESVAALPAMLTQEADAAEPPEIQEGEVQDGRNAAYASLHVFARHSNYLAGSKR